VKDLRNEGVLHALFHSSRPYLPRPQTGELPGGLPCIRFGEGAETLVILPALGGALRDVRAHAGFLAWYYRRYARAFRVYVIGRRSPLPPDCSTRTMAADYARALQGRIGPCHLVGISFGSLIAQHLAAEHPEVVRQLVLAAGGHRLTSPGRERVEHWLTLARDERWRELYLDTAAATFHGVRLGLYRSLLRLSGGRVAGRPRRPEDFIRSAEAALAHDATPWLGAIRSPSLIIGGIEDQLVPPVVLREMAEHIPGARLRMFAGTGHGVFAERKAAFEGRIVAFLLGRGH
jgi:pimeloyl-ACP methyl ester carboxylesterase